MRAESAAPWTGTRRIVGNSASSGLTLVDVLILVATAAMTLVMLPYVTRGRATHCRVSCINHVKQLGLAFRIFSNDHGDKFPWEVATNDGGSQECKLSQDVFRHFVVASNELNTPKILCCPNDVDRAINTDWAKFSNSDLSYFVSLDSHENSPDQWLTGDRNISGGVSSNQAIRLLTRRSVVKWTPAIHNLSGNIGFADGSAQQLASASLQANLQSNTMPVIRLAIP